MSTNRLDDVGGSARQAAAFPNDHIVEVAFLLPEWQVAALETAANGDCLTCGQLVRRLVRDFLEQKIASIQGLTCQAPLALPSCQV
jgi:hypothetical protein